MSDHRPSQLFYFSNAFPPDNLPGLFRRLRRQSKTQGHAFLRAFIAHSTTVLHEEIRQLPEYLRSVLPPFDNALDLGELQNWKRGPLAGSLEGILLCLLDIATFIGHHEKHEGQFNFSKATACFTGIGVGLLAAAAVAASPTLAELPQLGAEAVRIALRMGVLVDEKSQNIEAREPGSQAESWAAVIQNIDEETIQRELDAFNTSSNSPLPSQLFISAGGVDNITISGPPSKLRQIFRVSEHLRSARYAQLPVYGGLCHAPHLYNTDHCASIMERANLAVVNRTIVDAAPVLSTRDGAPFEATTSRELFEAVILELLTGTIRWNLAVDNALDRIESGTAGCTVYAFRPCGTVMEMVASAKAKAPESQFQICDLLDWAFQADDNNAPLRREDSKIAIVGMSCRFPGGANDLESFWDLLQEGRDVHQKVPADRYDVETHTDISGKTRNTSLTPFGCFIDHPGLFDAGFFDMSPREAAQTDPMHRLALMTAYEALEQAGFVPDRTDSTNRKNIGTFYGQSCDDYREANAGQEVDTYYIPGGCRAFAPGRINYFFKFRGPSFDCDTACSSSLATIQIACTSLLHGDSNMVVAGGLNVLTNSDGFAGLSRGHFLSKTGGCKTFDCNADGYCRADGIGSIVLKRLDDAQADNDNILGVILASATNHSADAISITHPHAPTQAELYRHVLAQAGVCPLEVDLVEMHGTGTQAGDATEMESITSAFSASKRSHPLYIGSVKANIGHGEAAAGVMALTKVLLALQRNAIPKHVGIKTALNPKFPDLARLNIQIPVEQVQWPRTTLRKRYAIVNNFSAAGGNTTVLLEEPPMRSEPGADPRTAFTVAISAKSKVSLERNLECLLAYLGANPEVSMAHLSYTTMARRMHHNHRIAVHGTSRETVMRRLEEYMPGVKTQRPIPNMAPSVAFVFSGQGSFYIGIARQLYELHPGFQSQIRRLDEICLSHGFPSFIPAITKASTEAISDLEPILTHLTIVCVSIALCRLWETLGVKACVTVGASLGEFAALYAAGVLSASDAIYLVGKRALLLQTLCSANTHSMLAVRATMEQVDDALAGQPYEVACLNGATDVTLSGSVDEIGKMRLAIEAHGYRCTQLKIPFAFHSAQVDPLLDQYETIASGVTFKDPCIPLISPLLADCVFDGKTIDASYMRNATRRPVQFANALDAAREIDLVDSKTVWVEIGPHASYSSFVRGAMPEGTTVIPTLKRDEDNWHTFSSGMAQLHNLGLNLDWNAWHAPFEAPYLRLLDLPAYQWNAKNYWIQYDGDWMLSKNNSSKPSRQPSIPEELRTALIHHLVEESIGETCGEVVVRSDILQAEYLDAMYGHKMNSCAVATSSIHAEVVFTLAKYLYSRINPQSPISTTNINVTNMQVLHGLIARKSRSKPQWIQVRAQADLSTRSIHLSWHNVNDHGEASADSFVTAVGEYGDPNAWLTQWLPMTHLISSRIEVLHQLAHEGTASRLSRDMAYSLFGNLVDYADKYRGMQTVILHGMEATAQVTLAPDQPGKWTVGPHYIDSVAHLAGFILNGGNVLDPRRFFYVTPGWGSMRFARPLVPGGQYVSYVKMLPVHGQPGFYAGDVYVLQQGEIVGMVQGISFRTFPRLLLDKFFTPPDVKGGDAAQTAIDTITTTATTSMSTPAVAAAHHHPPSNQSIVDQGSLQSKASTGDSPTSDSSFAAAAFTPDSSAAGSSSSPAVGRAMALIAQETEIELHELVDETAFSSIGVDSLMSLVLAQRFATELDLEVRSSLFMDCPTIGDFKAWLNDYY
ncbi:hypothetical protein FE257_006957 [Aspergillus nanangensis]|uniref:Polyketide synthase n=1 Tax=Aspergillus nanangensis TaxID=2582783 RepID=A0AAD4CP19_ASPNN|nr:hypothetical protein FE257_006957 [Aspergillus nanangensis]